ncbi:acyltransferase [Flavobacterium silvaticum]|uniref:Acyltransferase family protein n=1 Tax=Flavobacterium silvaticum TaxID=1852020 RepID=A0A972JIF8_9FLAO|nr:acyltransferase family protein [Flavobacterium silvaticum]NMH28183.1 acyltransferase family protein [Flavobacterium silvaticum]
MIPKAKTKTLWIENLRAIATVSVILLHVSSPLLYAHDESLNSYWWLGNVFDSAVRYCVPVFVMITGTLLLPQEIDLKVYFSRRISRILIPFLFWSLVYICNDLLQLRADGKSFAVHDIISFSISHLLYGASYHLWYVYMLICLYLVIPFLGRWIRHSSEKQIQYFLSLWICINAVWLFGNFGNNTVFYFGQFIGYLVLGYYISTKDFKLSLKVSDKVALLLYLTGVVVTLLGTYIVTERTGKFSNIFYDYRSVSVVASATGIFILTKNNAFTVNRHVSSLVSLIGKLSYGIYLVHVLVLYFLDKSGINATFIHPLIGIPLTAILCLFLSMLVPLLVQKLPYGKYIAG